MSIPLRKLPYHISAKITAIHARDELLNRMISWGIVPNCAIQVLRQAPFNGAMQIQLGHIQLMIPISVAKTIEVSVL